jgi:hypothetical protein
VDPVLDLPLLPSESGSAANRTWDLWVCSQVLWLLAHRGGRYGDSFTFYLYFHSGIFFFTLSIYGRTRCNLGHQGSAEETYLRL